MKSPINRTLVASAETGLSVGVPGRRAAAVCQAGSENLSRSDVMSPAALLCCGEDTLYTLSQGENWEDEKTRLALT